MIFSLFADSSFDERKNEIYYIKKFLFLYFNHMQKTI